VRLRFERRVSELPGAEGPRETGCMADLGIEAPPARRRANGAERGSTMATSIMDSGAGESAKGGGDPLIGAVHVLCTNTSLQEPKPAESRTAETRVFIGNCRLLSVPVAVKFAVRNQRSEVRILSGVSKADAKWPFPLGQSILRTPRLFAYTTHAG